MKETKMNCGGTFTREAYEAPQCEIIELQNEGDILSLSDGGQQNPGTYSADNVW